MTTTLSTRDLNRALMARQLLLDRHEMSALGAIEHLVGMEAQEPHEPNVGLWSRLQRFQPDELVELLQGRRVVRTLLMRRTLQPRAVRSSRSAHGRCPRSVARLASAGLMSHRATSVTR